jgi:hypothetical protein
LLSSLHMLIRAAQATYVKTTTTWQISLLLINWYSISLRRCHQVWYTDVQMKQNAFMWCIPVVTWRSLEKVLWFFKLHLTPGVLVILANSSAAGLNS